MNSHIQHLVLTAGADCADCDEIFEVEDNDHEEDVILQKSLVQSEDTSNPCNPGGFVEYCREMTKINKLLKKTIVQGSGDIVDLERQRITYEFASFIEDQVEAFDSSVKDKYPRVISIEEGIEPLPSHSLALATMKKGEEAVFLIPKELLMNSGFRIPKNVDVLFRCRVLSISDPKIPKKSDKNTVMKNVLKQMKVAQECFKARNYLKCIEIYVKLINMLEILSVSCDEDDQQRFKYLIKVYQNVILCYNKVDKPKKACIMIQQMQRITDITLNPVVLFAKGKAKMMLGDYSQARKLFLMAKNLNPETSQFEKIMIDLDRREKMNFRWVTEIENERQIFLAKEENIKKQKEEEIGAKVKKEQQIQVDLLSFQAELLCAVDDFKIRPTLEYMTLSVNIRSGRDEKLAESVCQEHGVEFKKIRSPYGDRTHYFLYKQIKKA